MKNKSKKIYGRLSALFLSVVLMMTGLSVTALEEEETNLITGFEPSFEKTSETDPVLVAEDVSEVRKVAGYYEMKYVDLGTDGGKSGNNYVKFRQEDAYMTIFAPVEPAKNYNFSFWMRNSAAKALQLGHCRFYVGDELVTSFSNSIIEYVNGNYHTSFGNGITKYGPTIDEEKYKFGIARSEGAANEWRQVTINFSTPPKCPGYDVTRVELSLSCLEDDQMLAVDDLSLVETGKKPNRIFNGDFEAIQDDKDVQDATGVFYSTGDNLKTTLKNEKGNHYYEIEATDSSNLWNIESIPAGFFQGRKTGTRYKISYRAKVANSSITAGYEPKTSLIMQQGSQSARTFQFADKLSTEWKTFTTYINYTEPARDGKILGGKSMKLGNFSSKYYKMCVDDFSAWYDEDGIGFYESLDLEYSNAETKERGYSIGFSEVSSYGGILKRETSIEATDISSLTPDPDTGGRTLKVRAHYLPKEVWGELDSASNTYGLTVESGTEVTLLSAVYKHEGDKKTLISVDIVSGTTNTNGESLDIVGEVTVPKATNDETYTVEAMAWDMSTMKPVMKKAELPYNTAQN